jgi:hypothetical protein
MSRLTWNDPGTKFFETGIDQGVLYVDNVGFAWNGLTAVTEKPTGGEAKPFYADGMKFLNVPSSEEFTATIEAFGAPPEFGPCDGTYSVQNGLFVGQQPRKAFSMSYRTLVGNDLLGKNYGYKIHLVWNALASPSERAYSSMNDSPEGVALSWEITTLPPSLTGYKPTAYASFDSRFTPRGLMTAIERILYGSDDADGRMPTLTELIDMAKSEGPLTRTNYVLNPAFRLQSISPDVEIRRNLITNPSARVTTGTVEVRRNLIVNPAFRASNGTIEVRKNLCVNPQPATATGYQGVGGVTSVSAPWNASRKAVRTVATGAGTAYMFSANGGETVTSGTVVTVSGTIQVPAGKYYRVYVHTTTGNFYYSSPTPMILSDGNPTRVSRTETLTSDATDLNLAVLFYENSSGTVLSSGVECFMGDVLIERADVAMPYFDGNTAAADGLTYAWTGTADATMSTATGIGVHSMAMSAGVVAWRGSDAASMRLLRKYGSGGWIEILSAYAPAAAAGEIYTESVSVSSDSAGTFSFGYTALGTTPTTTYNVATNTDANPQLLSATSGALAAGTTNFRPMLRPNTNGVIYTIRNLMVEIGKGVRTYFDGSTAAQYGITYSWTGAANTSASIATGNRPTDISGSAAVYAYNEFVVVSGQYVPGPQVGSIDTFAYVGGDAGSGFRLGMAAGKTYTLSAEGYATAADPNESSTLGRKLSIWYKDGAGVYQKVMSSAAVPVGNTPTRVSVTATIPSTATEAFIRLYNGASWGVRDVVWTKIRLEEEIIAKPYFDGTTAPGEGLIYRWSGAANNSPSQAVGKAMKGAGNSSDTTGKLWQTEDGYGAYLEHRGGGFSGISIFTSLITATTSRVTYAFDVVSPTNCTITHFITFGGIAGRVYKNTVLTAGVPTRVVQTVDDPLAVSGSITLYIGFHPSPNPAGVSARIRVDNLIIEAGDSDGSYFDGSSLDQNLNYYSWAGTPDDSLSYLNTWN